MAHNTTGHLPIALDPLLFAMFDGVETPKTQPSDNVEITKPDHDLEVTPIAQPKAKKTRGSTKILVGSGD